MKWKKCRVLILVPSYKQPITGVASGVDHPVRECRFISCVAIGKQTGSQTNEADGGGLVFWENDYTLGISNSLFAKCESKKRAGGSFVVVKSSSFSNVIRFCFYCENIAPQGRNALIHFNSSSTTLWSIVFLHSFTSDTTLSKSLAQSHSNPTEVTSNWLPITTRIYI